MERRREQRNTGIQTKDGRGEGGEGYRRGMEERKEVRVKTRGLSEVSRGGVRGRGRGYLW